MDQLDKADAPLNGTHPGCMYAHGISPRTAILHLALLAVQKQTRDRRKLTSTEPLCRARVCTQTGAAISPMLNEGWPAFLASLSFLLTTNLIFGDASVLGAPQTLARPTHRHGVTRTRS